MKLRLLLLLLSLIFLSGCQDRGDAVAWAGVWHVAKAMKEGYPVESGAQILQGMADRHAEINEYEIDKRGIPMIKKEDQ